MICWRIAREPFADLSGIGGERADGRWHSKPRRIVYLASSLSLAALEILVNLDLPSAQLPADLVAMRVDIPETVSTEALDRSELPEGWTRRAGWPDCQRIGNAWWGSRRSALLAVPSAVVPLERNLLLNPMHAEAGAIPSPELSPFGFDERLLALLDAKFGGAPDQH